MYKKFRSVLFALLGLIAIAFFDLFVIPVMSQDLNPGDLIVLADIEGVKNSPAMNFREYAVLKIDPVTGQSTYLSHNQLGSGISFSNGMRGLIFEGTNSVLTKTSIGVIRINLDSGNRAYISSVLDGENLVGSGVLWSSVGHMARIDDENIAVDAFEFEQTEICDDEFGLFPAGSVINLNTSTGHRSVISGPLHGVGDCIEIIGGALVYDENRGKIFVYQDFDDNQPPNETDGSIVEIDYVTGNRENWHATVDFATFGTLVHQHAMVLSHAGNLVSTGGGIGVLGRVYPDDRTFDYMSSAAFPSVGNGPPGLSFVHDMDVMDNGIIVVASGDSGNEHPGYVGFVNPESGDRQILTFTVDELPPHAPFVPDFIRTNFRGVATVPGINFVGELTTGSPVSIIQNIDTGNEQMDLAFSYIFKSTFGELTVHLNDQLLQTISAPMDLTQAYTTVSIPIDGSLLNQDDIPLRLTLDGNPDASIWLDNIQWPSLSNGDFQTQDLTNWSVSGDGTATAVERVADTVLGDVNLDGSVDLLDVAPFVGELTAGGLQAEADINQDGVVDLLDVAPFVALLTS